MDVLSQSEIDALLKKMLSDPSVLPDDEKKQSSPQPEHSPDKPHIQI